MLLCAHDVARAAQLEVAHGDLEAASEFRVLADGCEPLLLDLGQHLAAAECEVGVGASRASADASPQLVELRQAHAVGVFYNKGVGVRQVNSRFDYRGADEDVYLLLEHLSPDLAELVLLHLAVADRDFRVWNRLLDPRGAGRDRLDVVVKVKYLTAAAHFASYCLVDHRVVVL